MNVASVFLDETGNFVSGHRIGPRTEPWIIAGVMSTVSRSETEALLSEHLDTVVKQLCSSDWFQCLRIYVESEISKQREQVQPLLGKSFDEKSRLKRKSPDLAKAESLIRLGNQLLAVDKSSTRLHYAAFVEWIKKSGEVRYFDELAHLRDSVLSIFDDSQLRQVAIINDMPESTFDSVNFAITLQSLVFDLASVSRSYPSFTIAARKHEDNLERLKEVWSSQFANSIASSYAILQDLEGATSRGLDILVDDQEESPGLTVADFVCAQARSGWRKFQNRNVDTDKYREFLAASGFSVFSISTGMLDRIVRSCEGRADFLSGILIAIQYGDVDICVRLLERQLTNSNPSTLHYRFESVIDRFDQWAQTEEKTRVVSSLKCLRTACWTLWKKQIDLGNEQRIAKVHLARLDSYCLTWANHVGDKQLFELLEKTLTELMSKIAGSEKETDILFSMEINRIEYLLNDHRYEEAQGEANDHFHKLLGRLNVGPNDSEKHLNQVASCYPLLRAATTRTRADALVAQASANKAALKAAYTRSLEIGGRLGLDSNTGFRIHTDSIIRLLTIAGYCAEALMLHEPRDPERLEKVWRTHACLAREPDNTAFADSSAIRCAASLAALGVWSEEMAETITVIGDRCMLRSKQGVRHPDEVSLRELVTLWLSTGVEATVLNRPEQRLKKWLAELEPKCETHRHQVRLTEKVLALAREASSLSEDVFGQRFAEIINIRARSIN